MENKSGKMAMCNKIKSWFPHGLHCRPNSKFIKDHQKTINSQVESPGVMREASNKKSSVFVEG